MNKYSSQAQLYSNGVSEIKNEIDEVLIELLTIKEKLKDEQNSRCPLKKYVELFNNDVIEQMEKLEYRCFNNSNFLIRKANELDYLENLEGNNNGDTSNLFKIDLINGKNVALGMDLKKMSDDKR